MSASAKVAIVLGGGGIKPAIAIPLFNFLRENHIPISLIVGSSGGGLVGALEALNMPETEIEKVLTKVSKCKYFTKPNKRQLLALLNVPFMEYDPAQGMIIPTLMKEDLKEVFKDLTFDQLYSKLIVTGTDLDTGENISINQGLVREALYATSSIFPFMPPANIGGRRIVDGSFSAPIPIETAIRDRPDLIIVMTFTFLPDYAPKGFFTRFDNLFCLSIERKGLQALEEAKQQSPERIVHIKACLDEPVYIFETERIPTLLTLGKELIDKARDEIITKYQKIVNTL